ncbi:MAG: hypothetical protein LBQ22_10400 [Bacteroidales bacterium]|jgi:hypothetical protein|nr:hypothetical protein [Bacteroidales bacterium]
MTIENFGMGFNGRNPFDKDARKKFQERWSKMTDDEKLDFMNKKVEHMGKDHFSVESIDDRCMKWIEKTPEEKQAFVDERKEAMENHFGKHFSGHHGFGRFEDCFFGAKMPHSTESK